MTTTFMHFLTRTILQWLTSTWLTWTPYFLEFCFCICIFCIFLQLVAWAMIFQMVLDPLDPWISLGWHSLDVPFQQCKVDRRFLSKECRSPCQQGNSNRYFGVLFIMLSPSAFFLPAVSGLGRNTGFVLVLSEAGRAQAWRLHFITINQASIESDQLCRRIPGHSDIHLQGHWTSALQRMR